MTRAGGVERRGADRSNAGTVLVVDDSVATRRILCRALVAAGYGVQEAGDGRQALEACRVDRPDLVLLDIDMPVMDGLAALREMKRDAALSSLPVLFLTARTGGTDVAAGLELGAQDYLRKPCEPAELVARVATVLRRRHQEMALERQAHALDELVATDALTGVGNRRRFETRVAELSGDAAVSVLMMDIDHFKQVNDSEGHPVGDLVLRIVARRLQRVVDYPHLLARWGGEEFVVLAIGLTDAATTEFGELLRETVGATPVAVDVAKEIEVTVSVGCAVGIAADVGNVIRSADLALYEAKRSGRNRVVPDYP